MSGFTLWLEAKEIREKDATSLCQPRKTDGSREVNANDVSGKGSTACMQRLSRRAARCVGGCGTHYFPVVSPAGMCACSQTDVSLRVWSVPLCYAKFTFP